MAFFFDRFPIGNYFSSIPLIEALEKTRDASAFFQTFDSFIRSSLLNIDRQTCQTYQTALDTHFFRDRDSTVSLLKSTVNAAILFYIYCISGAFFLPDGAIVTCARIAIQSKMAVVIVLFYIDAETGHKKMRRG